MTKRRQSSSHRRDMDHDAEDGDGPRDPVSFRLTLLRRMSSIRQGWRRCERPSCRRMRRCDGPDDGADDRPWPCQRDSGPPMSEKDRARSIARLRRMLEARVAEIEAVPANPKPKPGSKPGSNPKPAALPVRSGARLADRNQRGNQRGGA